MKIDPNYNFLEKTLTKKQQQIYITIQKYFCLLAFTAQKYANVYQKQSTAQRK